MVSKDVRKYINYCSVFCGIVADSQKPYNDNHFLTLAN